ncbi:MAG: DUF3592 domain-containing protein [Clostridia bacterium]|nr:DUF3592 domain-containing protein [Clostridia bacterium]
MNIENKFARFMRNTGPARFLIPAGLILIIFGLILIGFKTDNYAETVGKVTAVQQYIDNTGEDRQTVFDVSFDYTVDGKQYSGSFNGIGTSYNVGDEIKVFYDPEDPDKTTNSKGAGTVGAIAIGLGALAAVGGVLSAVKAFHKSKELDEQIVAAGGSLTIDPIPKSQLTEYYVSYDGQMMKPGYIVEDGARNVVYEGKMEKNALVGSRHFVFTDHRKGTTEEHEVGHTITQSFNDEFFSTKSSFKFDGENIWDVLHGRGIRIQTDMTGKFPNMVYTIGRNGQFLATVETSGKYVHEEDAAEHRLNIPVGRYYYRVWTRETDLSDLFLTVFAISETEQTVVE